MDLSSAKGECEGLEFEIIPAIEGGLRPYQYNWSTGSIDSSIIFIGPVSQLITLTVTDACGATNKAQSQISFQEYDPLEFYFGGENDLCIGEYYEIYLEAKGGAGNFQYSVINNLNLEPEEVFEQLDTNTYKISFQSPRLVLFSVVDFCGNTVEDSINFTVDPCVLIPNVITPNGDGINDAFKISNVLNIPDASLTIYNRWGMKVFESNRYLNDWVPSVEPSGTYFYILSSSKFPEYRGTVTVLND